MTPQPLLIALVSIQFLVHALGWAMAARLTGRWRMADGHFALNWLFLSSGLMLYVPPFAAGSAPRDLGDLLIIASSLMQHRGLTLYWGRRPPDRAYLAVGVFAVALLAWSFVLDNGHGLRVANVCLGVDLTLLPTVWLVWRQGRKETPALATATAAGFGLLGLALAARAIQALTVAPSTKISIDAPGHANIPFAILVLFIGGMMNLAQVRLVLGRVLRQLNLQAQTDALTGALNRRGMMLRLLDLHSQGLREGGGYSLLMVDVDHFKAINDVHGHAEGDRVLARVAQGLREALRAGDPVGRWGGEEFCVALPGTALAEARALAEGVKERIAALPAQARVTVSIGVAERHEADEGPEALLRRADEALYRAKAAGRNKVMAARVPESTSPLPPSAAAGEPTLSGT